jgi:phosphinothricin acetyltransferase
MPASPAAVRPAVPAKRLPRIPGLNRSPLIIRHAVAADAAAITAIYNEGIAERDATFETRPRGLDEIEVWIAGRVPVLVAELDGSVVGFAKIGPYSEREVYSGIGEHGVYVGSGARRHGAGRALLEALAGVAQEAGLYKLTSRIFSTNRASIALHQATGFTIVGVQRHHGQLEGIWRDCVLVERLLGDAAAEADRARAS